MKHVAQGTLNRSKTTKGSNNAGFTLIEIMVVLAIIGVLSALIVPNVMDRFDQAKVLAARADIANLTNALKMYRLDNGTYPSGEEGLAALVNRPVTQSEMANWRRYIDNLPSDPWGNPYVYVNPGVQNEVDVVSYGGDGQPGGEGMAADVYVSK